jgi:hypothetical protein
MPSNVREKQAMHIFSLNSLKSSESNHNKCTSLNENPYLGMITFNGLINF